MSSLSLGSVLSGLAKPVISAAADQGVQAGDPAAPTSQVASSFFKDVFEGIPNATASSPEVSSPASGLAKPSGGMGGIGDMIKNLVMSIFQSIIPKLPAAIQPIFQGFLSLFGNLGGAS